MGAAAPFAIMGGLQLAGTAYQYQQQKKMGKAQERYYNYLASQADKNAALTLKRGEEQVTSIQDAGAKEALNYKRSSSKVFGDQRTAYAASGISSDSVTASDIERDTTKSISMDQDAIRYDADSKSYQAKVAAADQARALADQAKQLRYAAKNAREAGGINAMTSLVNGASSVAGTYASYRMNNPTAPKVQTAHNYYSGYGVKPYDSKNILSLY